jgi:hypothetical protein
MALKDAPRRRFVGWGVKSAERARLLGLFPPRYGTVVADHVTQKPDDAPLADVGAGRIVGRADDRQGVEALVVEIAGDVRRPDGGVYHITWSLGPAREAVESNAVIAALGWTPVDPPEEVALAPASWP